MSKESLYKQIAENIRINILEGRYLSGTRLPTVREMMQIWNCTSGTVQRAYQELSSQGLITSHPGRGTMVADLNQSDALELRRLDLQQRISTFLSETHDIGYSPSEIEQETLSLLENLKSQHQSNGVEPRNTLRFIGSNDLAIEWMASHIKDVLPDLSMSIRFKGSLGGLLSLADGSADITGCHLWDEQSDSYNIPYIQKIFPGEKIAMLTLSHRRLGLIYENGNPLNIKSLSDITTPGVNFVNRQSGSGTRVWLDAKLSALGIEKNQIYGYQNEKTTHIEVARAVSTGVGNLGLGLEAAALSLGLSFLPLTLEKYDLVFRSSKIEASIIYALKNWLSQTETKEEITKLGGYETYQSGNLIWIN